MDRVMYTPLSPRKPDFDLIVDLMLEAGLLPRRLEFHEYVDPSFAEKAEGLVPWAFEPGAVE
jgi:NitT/TauT family transport system substrate-binding protein